jgi:glycosyltransferase involved in cell wall biosynthesis
VTDAAPSFVSLAAAYDGVETHARAPREAAIATPTFSVVIPTYNEERDISDTLERVLAQGLPPLDVIVVDGGSVDGTLAHLRRWAGDPRVSVVEEGRRRGVSAARNEGIRRAKGDVVVILNADVLLPRNFLERLAPLYRGDADLVSVDSRVANLGCMAGRYVDSVHKVKYSAASVGWSEGFSCRREAALAAAFPEEIPGAGGEDVEFVDRLLRAGYRWQVDYSICVDHRVPDTMSGFWAQCHGRGRSIPYIEHSLKRWPLPLVTARRSLAWLKTVVTAAIIVPNVATAAKLARRSPRGLRDLPSMWFAHHVLFAALRIGEYQGLRELWRTRRRAQ